MDDTTQARVRWYPSVRSDTAQALSRVGPAAKEAIPTLEELRKDEDAGVRFAAEDALTEIRREPHR